MHWLWVVVLVTLGGCVSGGDGTQGFEGCGSDVDCKGDRICVEGSCTDPDAAGEAASGGGDESGDASSGESGGQSEQSDAGPASSSGVGGSGGSGGLGEAGGGRVDSVFVDDPDLEAACIRDCEAKHAAQCEMPIGSLDQCMGQCLVIDEINGGYCLDERREQYDCLAEGGYTCVQGYPQPQSTCINEAQALATCSQEYPCRRLCDEIEGTSCAPEGDCFESCRATEQEGFEDYACSFDYSRLVTCWGLNPECDGDRVSVANCQREVVSVADCIGLRTSECEGFCWAAEILGCGSSDCVSECSSNVDDAACGRQYERLVECAYDSYDALYLSCEDGVPTLTEECESEAQEYETCVQGT